jgi:hypothetical protein
VTAKLHKLKFDGAILDRGFWLYVWEITTSDDEKLYYVGRTGDSSSSNAQSPFNRMGQHLGFNVKSNVLRRHLKINNIDPEKCKFCLFSFGPILVEAKSKDEHRASRDCVAAMEKALADAMQAAGCSVMNTVACRKPLDIKLFEEVRSAFAAHFPKL